MNDNDAQSEVIEALLQDAEADLEMAELGINAKNRLAAFHVQQAAEKLIKAVRAHCGLRQSSSHDLEELIDGSEHARPSLVPIPDDAPYRSELLGFSELTQYATTFRYPTPSGRLRVVPMDSVDKHRVELVKLSQKMRDRLLSKSPA